MKKMLKPLGFVLAVHCAALGVMSLFRLVFFCSVRGQLPAEASARPDWIARAFANGLWFDNVIACYLTALPLLVAVVALVAGRWRPVLYKAFAWWYGLLYALVFMGCAANVPYFDYFSRLLNGSIWNWAEYGTQTFGMIFGEPSWWGYIALYFLSAAGFGGFLAWLARRFAAPGPRRAPRPQAVHRLGALAVGALLIGACLLGIRGRLGYNPIKVSAAYFCESPVLNNLGVNPVFNLLYSSLDDLRPENQKLRLMPEAEALSATQAYLGRTGLPGISPLARRVVAEGEPTRENVVVVLMESMSARLLGCYGNGRRLTPCLDALSAKSLVFDNFYSAGIHTNHGIYATLYGFPAIMFRNAMKGSVIPRYSGLPTVLQEQGYETLFFMTHESQYDNMNAFLRTNGFDQIHAQENYPKEKIANHFGVPDDFLFSYAVPRLTATAARGKPFFATLLTISNHPPYVVPEAFRDPALSEEEQIVRYADRCIGDFMEAAAREPWFANTVFVFLGDHGKLVGQADCELPESYNHIPLLVYSPRLEPRRLGQFAVQEDVGPTLLGLLGVSYVQNNFGTDLLREQRPAAFYTADKTIAARDSLHLYVFNDETKQEFAYRLAPGAAPRPLPGKLSPALQQLKRYAFSQLQAAEYLVGRELTTDRAQNPPK